MNQVQTMQEDVIDLHELFDIIKKRKKLVFFVTGAITALAFVYAFFIATPIYSVRSMIELGQIRQKPIDSVSSVKERLSYQYKVNSKGMNKSLPYVNAITIPKNSETIFTLDIYGHNNEEATKYLETVVSDIKSQYNQKMESYVDRQKTRIAQIDQDINATSHTLQKMERELTDYDKRILTLQKEDAALAGIYAMQIIQKQTQLISLQDHLSELKNTKQDLLLSLSPLNMTPTNMLGEPEVRQSPVKPKKKLIVVVAFITGLMLSIFLVFFLEFLAKGKE
jgi:uncharacterized protein involved in exopolysaccharide biosynthesis